MDITCLTPAQTLEMATAVVSRSGTYTSPRGMGTYELNNVTLIVQQPWHLPMLLKGRELRDFIGAAECLQLVGQTSAPELMVRKVAKFGSFQDAGIFHGAYGIRVYGQFAKVVDQLLKDPDSRQAVLTIYESKQDLHVDRRDVPCTLSIQFLIRDNTLCARTSMRSNDVYLGLPYDLIQFIGLQGAVAAALGLQMGWYAHTVGSLHLYLRDMEKASEVKAVPLAKDTVADARRRLWSPGSPAGISRRARDWLNGEASDYEKADAILNGTPFERYLVRAMHS